MGLDLDHPGMEGKGTSTDHGRSLRQSRRAPRRDMDRPRPAPARQSRMDLIQIIEGEIIPRLFLAHRDRTPHPLAGAVGDVGDMTNLARMFMDGNAADIVDQLQKMLGDGMRRDRLYLDLLAPVPITLSRLWSEGECSFDEIAVGLCCVDEVLQQLHEREQSEGQPGRTAGEIT